MITIAIIVAYTTAFMAAAAATRSMLAARRLARLSLSLTARHQQASEDRAFVEWANWTMISVTDSKGYISAATMRQLYTTGQWDHIWDTPLAVAIWHGNPDVVQRFETELREERG